MNDNKIPGMIKILEYGAITIGVSLVIGLALGITYVVKTFPIF